MVVGAINTVIGYSVGVGAYLLLATHLPVLAIGLISNVVAIVISFVSQRLWVFRSRDAWCPQLRRSFMVYGAISVIGTAMLWPLLEVAGLSIWLAQGVVLVVCTSLAYVGQKWFTFHRSSAV